MTDRRYLALWFPFLPIERHRGRKENGGLDEAPFVLIGQETGTQRLAALDEKALVAGLRPGMGLADARALIPALQVAALDRQGDAAHLVHCALACEIFTPLVGLDGNDGLILDITGCAHLFGGETSLHDSVLRRFAALGLTGRASIADTPEAAHALARFGRARIIPPGQTGVFTRTLPIAALEAAPEIAIALQRAGLRSIDDLASRPSAALTARFGKALTDQLCRLLGEEDIRITPLRPPPEISSEQHFASPFTSLERLKQELHRLARHICRMLEERGEGGRIFEASFFRADGAVRQVRVDTAQGVRDPASLLRLFELRLENLTDRLDPGFGFDALRLAVLRSETVNEHAPSLATENTAQTADLREHDALVNRLIARFGARRVLRYVARDSHDPDRASAQVPALSEKPSAPWPRREEGEPPARPLLLFNPPEPVEVLAEVPDGPPLRLRRNKSTHEIIAAEGPERLAPEWWNQQTAFSATRDYYRIEDGAGQRFWVFREGFYGTGQVPRWYVHGMFA